MSIQICLLETGESIIADVKEAIDPEQNKAVGYFVTNPFIIEHVYDTVVALDDEVVDQPEDKSTISFKRWAPLARRFEFNYEYDFVRVIYEPATSLVETYVSLIQKWQEDHTEVIEADKSKTNITIVDPALEGMAENQQSGRVIENTLEYFSTSDTVEGE